MIKRKKLTKTERQTVYAKTDGHCAYCGCDITLRQMQVDHVASLYQDALHGSGTADTIDNMLPACQSCNRYKSTMTLETFRAALSRIPDVLLRDNATYRIAVRYGLVTPAKKTVVFYFERRAKDDNGTV